MAAKQVSRRTRLPILTQMTPMLSLLTQMTPMLSLVTQMTPMLHLVKSSLLKRKRRRKKKKRSLSHPVLSVACSVKMATSL